MNFKAVKSVLGVLLMLTSLLVFQGCGKTSSLFGSIDKPGNDEQYLNKARACMDDNDIPCAKENYGKITTPTEAVYYEEGFLLLTDVNAGLEKIASAFGGKEASIFKKLAESLGKVTAEKQTERTTAIATAKADFANVTGDAGTYAKAIADLIYLSTILSQQMGDDNLLQTTDIATNPTACAAETAATFYASCTGPMTNADALLFKTQLQSANANISLISGGAGDFSKLLGESEGTFDTAVRTACVFQTGQTSGAAYDACVAGTSSDLKAKVVRNLIITEVLK